MTREEFDREFKELTGRKAQITPEDYTDIEYVYTFHPSISETAGKREIANLVATFGMAIIRDMKPRAEQAESLESEIRVTQAKLEDLKEELKALGQGRD